MGTIINEDGFRLMIYSNDHLPPHVHVYKSGVEAKISISQNPYLIESTRMKSIDLKKALIKVQQYYLILISTWSDIHG